MPVSTSRLGYGPAIPFSTRLAMDSRVQYGSAANSRRARDELRPANANYRDERVNPEQRTDTPGQDEDDPKEALLALFHRYGMLPSDVSNAIALIADLVAKYSVAEPAEDEPPPFRGQPLPGGQLRAMDAALRRGASSVAHRFPDIRRLKSGF